MEWGRRQGQAETKWDKVAERAEQKHDERFRGKQTVSVWTRGGVRAAHPAPLKHRLRKDTGALYCQKGGKCMQDECDTVADSQTKTKFNIYWHCSRSRKNMSESVRAWGEASEQHTTLTELQHLTHLLHCCSMSLLLYFHSSLQLCFLCFLL